MRFRWALVPVFLILIISLGGEILIYGDTRNHPEIHEELVQRVKNSEFSLVFHTGDQNQRGTHQREYDDFIRIVSPLRGDFYPVRGNHERDLQLFLENFPQLPRQSYYSFADEDFVYVILDSNLDLLPQSEQHLWMLEELKRAQKPVIIFLHHPVFSSGEHGQELGLELYLPRIFGRHNVVMVVSGHEHSFEHLEHEGIHYLVTGGGGAPLRPMGTKSPFSKHFDMIHHYSILRKSPLGMQIMTFDLEGEMIYEFFVSLRDSDD